METFVLIAAILYVAVGELRWREIVVPEHFRWDRYTDMNEAMEDYVYYAALKEQQKNPDLGYLVVKGNFLLIWPLALVYGYVSARLEEMR